MEVSTRTQSPLSDILGIRPRGDSLDTPTGVWKGTFWSARDPRRFVDESESHPVVLESPSLSSDVNGEGKGGVSVGRDRSTVGLG